METGSIYWTAMPWREQQFTVTAPCQLQTIKSRIWKNIFNTDIFCIVWFVYLFVWFLHEYSYEIIIWQSGWKSMSWKWFIESSPNQNSFYAVSREWSLGMENSTHNGCSKFLLTFHCTGYKVRLQNLKFSYKFWFNILHNCNLTWSFNNLLRDAVIDQQL